MKSIRCCRNLKWAGFATLGCLFTFNSPACINSETFTPLLLQSVATFITKFFDEFYGVLFPTLT